MLPMCPQWYAVLLRHVSQLGGLGLGRWGVSHGAGGWVQRVASHPCLALALLAAVCAGGVIWQEVGRGAVYRDSVFEKLQCQY